MVIDVIWNRDISTELRESSPRTKLAIEAVTRLLAHSRNAWSKLKVWVLLASIMSAATEPRKPTTMA